MDGRNASGKGVLLTITPAGQLQLQMNDGKTTAAWDTDSSMLKTGVPQHAVFIVDGAPHIISVVVNGKLCNGGTARDYGWTRFDQALTDVNGSTSWKLANKLHGKIKNIKVYNRYLHTAEAVANYKAAVQ